MQNQMTSITPYMFKAFYEWLCANNLRSFIKMIPEYYRGTEYEFLQKYAQQDGTVNLNITPSSIGDFKYTTTGFSFTCYFNGVKQEMIVSYEYLLSVFAPDTNPMHNIQFAPSFGQKQVSAVPEAKAKTKLSLVKKE